MKLRKVLIGLAVLLLAATVGFVIWAENPLGPAPEALAALQSDAQVRVTAGAYTVFQPADGEPVTGLIFYPGGRVDRSTVAPKDPKGIIIYINAKRRFNFISSQYSK